MRSASSVLLEALVVALLGALVALAANGLSPRGLHLTRNYFPGGPKASVAVSPSTRQTNSVPIDPTQAVLARLQQHGLQVVRSNEVAALFHDPGYQQGTIVF